MGGGFRGMMGSNENSGYSLKKNILYNIKMDNKITLKASEIKALMESPRRAEIMSEIRDYDLTEGSDLEKLINKIKSTMNYLIDVGYHYQMKQAEFDEYLNLKEQCVQSEDSEVVNGAFNEIADMIVIAEKIAEKYEEKREKEEKKSKTFQ